MTKSTAPTHLSAPARRLFAAVLDLYVLEAPEIAILTKALEAWDRGEQAREILAADGILITTRLGERKAHPAVAIERDSRGAFMAGMKQLALDFEPVPNHARTAAARAARWPG